MAWECYKLVYQAKSPIHIGWHTLGYIKRTRYYITGKAMWGAMTANLVRARHTYNDYRDIGDHLRSKIFISYFYPALEQGKELNPILPKYTEEGLKYNKDNEEYFERIFISSYGQTAVLPENNTAEDESLHESEYINPVVDVNGAQTPVYFIGYVFINTEEAKYKDDNLTWPNIKNAFAELFVGGDRKYGWGRLRLDERKTREEKNTFFGLTLDINKLKIEITLPKGSHIPAHLLIKSGAEMKGDLEPMVGREWGVKADKGGFGQEISPAEICWVPGSVVINEKGEKLQIGAYGLLKK